ncbi:MAG TPA: hypothetical protein PK986_03170 [Spirochaetota bacterium]|jgi:hypothetical protein|nr:hypothetical protein [Spirochaetota bacterium]
MQVLKEDFAILDLLIESCDIDFKALTASNIDRIFFSDYSNQRIVNSFLFNYIKIQDKTGTKLFKHVLYELKEIDDYSIPMIDVLNNLEKLNIIEKTDEWDRLREIRNNVTHEYPSDIDERIENIKLTLEGYSTLKKIYNNTKAYCTDKGLL